MTGTVSQIQDEKQIFRINNNSYICGILLKKYSMTVINSKEFISNQKRYFDLAVNEQVFIKRGKNTYHLICTTIDKTVDEMVYHEPDEDFYGAISIDELQKRVKKDIHQWYQEKYENSSNTKGTTIS